jgi:hypothetical protein
MPTTTSMDVFSQPVSLTGNGDFLRYVDKNNETPENNDTLAGGKSGTRDRLPLFDWTLEKPIRYFKRHPLKGFRIPDVEQLQPREISMIAHEQMKQFQNMNQPMVIDTLTEMISDVLPVTNGGRTLKTQTQGGTAITLLTSGILVKKAIPVLDEDVLEELKSLAEVARLRIFTGTASDTNNYSFGIPWKANDVIVICSSRIFKIVTNTDKFNARLLTKEQAKEHGIAGQRVMELGQGTLLIEENYLGLIATANPDNLLAVAFPKINGAKRVRLQSAYRAFLNNETDSTNKNLGAEMEYDGMAVRGYKAAVWVSADVSVVGSENSKRTISLTNSITFSKEEIKLMVESKTQIAIQKAIEIANAKKMDQLVGKQQKEIDAKVAEAMKGFDSTETITSKVVDKFDNAVDKTMDFIKGKKPEDKEVVEDKKSE